MRKEYIVVESDHVSDHDIFIEDYWTNIWKQHGDPNEYIHKVAGRDEYKIMEPYLSGLDESSLMLDGGCGLGEWATYFTRNGRPTIGLDLSKHTIEKLSDIFEDVDFRSGDIRHMNFEDETFDAYFSWGVFEHFEKGMSDCVSEALRVLKPSGFLFISVPFDNIRHAFRNAGDTSKTTMPDGKPKQFYQWRFTKSELRENLNMSGFEVLEVKSIHNRQGVLRSLHHEFKLPYTWFVTRAMSYALSPFVPSVLTAHMVMAVARKPV